VTSKRSEPVVELAIVTVDVGAARKGHEAE
jgi:hypothetical protein